VVNDPAERLLLDGHFYYSGEIPQVRADAPWQPDPFLMDERMLVVHVRHLGLIAFGACSHAGIVNICKSATCLRRFRFIA
jgi:7,8-dihydropterin-6-yl-methyl-4-(beta-D-ribofuranosyl)aminobenzene 5'-phosphate synthase